MKFSFAQYILIFIALPLLVAISFFVKSNRLTTVTLSDIRWEKVPNFIVVGNEQRDGKDGILFLRPKDGKEQFVIGTSKVTFAGNGAYSYGEFPAEKDAEDQKPKYEIYSFSPDGNIYNIDISNLDGQVASIQENPKSTYIFIEISRDDKTSYCVAEKTSGESVSCQQLDVGVVSKGMWNPKKDHELVIKTSKDELVTFDPWEKGPIFIAPSTPAHQELGNLFADKKRDWRVIAGANGDKKFWNFFNIILTKDDSGWDIYRSPFNATVAWFADSNHMIVRHGDNLSFLELSSKKIAPILHEKDLKNKPIQISHEGIDLTLEGK